ncbi:hypothetical protein J6590_020382 [Homalodisca vitripennis]|nr:hypothetical protein J6590_020382 [Homalodisca vitripennis]
MSESVLTPAVGGLTRCLDPSRVGTFQQAVFQCTVSNQSPGALVRGDGRSLTARRLLGFGNHERRTFNLGRELAETVYYSLSIYRHRDVVEKNRHKCAS